MLVVMLVCVGAWMRLGKSYPRRIIVVVVLGIVAVGATTLTGSIPPITDYPMGQDQALRVYPPTAFPFTLQQHRDYDAGLFHYRIVLGWPDGLQVFAFNPRSDQSEYMAFQKALATLVLGGCLAIGLLFSVPVILGLEKYSGVGRESTRAEKASLLDKRFIGILFSLVLMGIGSTLMWIDKVVSIMPGYIAYNSGLTIIFLGWVLFVCFAVLPWAGGQSSRPSSLSSVSH